MIEASSIRLRACAQAPYLSAALFQMNLIVLQPEDEEYKEIQRMGVDENWNCYLNSEFVDNIGIELAANVLIHEVYHLISNHAERSKKILNVVHEIANIAADMAINQDMKSNDWQLPPDCWFPENMKFPNGLLFEEYYELLIKNTKTIKFKPDDGKEGSGATGQKENWEKEGNKNQKMSPEKAKAIRQKVAKDVEKTIGKVPGGLKRWAKEILEPQIPWTTKLSSAIRGITDKKAGMVDYTYSRPSRRGALYSPFIMPKMVAPIPKVSVITDTSGSMDEGDFKRGLAEIKGILQSLGVPIKVYGFDAALHTQEDVWDVQEIELVGGGGTNMGLAIEQVAEQDSCTLLVVITDGYTPWCSKKPDNIDHIIAVITQKNQTKSVPSFIEAIEID